MRPTLGFFSRLLLSSLLLLASAPAMAADRLVVAFGDSLTAGYNLGPGEGSPATRCSPARRDRS
ncbi:hypothetical protein [Hankyongella ginsenosidimutans]|uniref:hypothetical protein n=1 Tax=Hankyongella ginsenosidimutans TaxID=1763828 RepID=UPI003CCC8BD4